MSLSRLLVALPIALMLFTWVFCLESCGLNVGALLADANALSSLMGDGNSPPPVASSSNSLVTQTLDVSGSANFQITNSTVATTAGWDGNYQLTMQSVVFDAYSTAQDSNPGRLFAFLSSEPNLCLNFSATGSQTVVLPPFSTLAVFWMQTIASNQNELVPSQMGNYQIGGTTGAIAGAKLYRLDGNCVVIEQNLAKSGIIDITNMVGGPQQPLQQLGATINTHWGQPLGTINGDFNAVPCARLAINFNDMANRFACTKDNPNALVPNSSNH